MTVSEEKASANSVPAAAVNITYCRLNEETCFDKTGSIYVFLKQVRRVAIIMLRER